MEDCESTFGRKKKLEKSKVSNNKDITKFKKKCSNLRKKKRVGRIGGLDALFDNILKTDANIYREAYHGGELNGVCVRRFLENSTVLMKKITALVSERRDKDDGRTGYDNRCTSEELDKTMGTYSDLFRVMDLLFSLLRIPAPTVNDIKNAKKTVAQLEQLWKQLNISETPKAHIIFKHTVVQYEYFGGIADKAEDFVEKAHQIGKRLEYLTSRLPSGDYKRKQLIHFQRMWMQQDPDVEMQINNVRTSSKRKLRHPLRNSSRIKRECRSLLRTKTKEEIVNQSHFEVI